MLDSFV